MGLYTTNNVKLKKKIQHTMVWMYVMTITTPWGSPHSSSLSAKNHKTDPRDRSLPTSKIPCEHKIKSAALPQLQGLV